MNSPASPKRAFTLLELTLAIVVLGISAALATPTYNQVVRGANSHVAEASALSTTREAVALAGASNRLLASADITTAITENQNIALGSISDQNNTTSITYVVTSPSGAQSTVCVSVPDWVNASPFLCGQAPGGAPSVSTSTTPTTVPSTTPTTVTTTSTAAPGTVLQNIFVGTWNLAITATANAVWTASNDSSQNWASTVDRIDPATGAITAQIPVGSSVRGLVALHQMVWAANSNDNTVSEIDPTTNTVINTIAVGSQPWAIAAYGDYVYTANAGDNTVTRIDATTGQPTTFSTQVQPVAIGADANGIWVAGVGYAERLNPTTGAEISLTPLDAPGFDYFISDDGTNVWVSSQRGTLSKFSATTGGLLDTISLGEQITSVSSNGTEVWVNGQQNANLLEINPTTDQVLNTYPVPAGPSNMIGLVYTGTGVWYTNYAYGTVVEVQP